MRSQHISKNGKAECGINWCTDSTNDSTTFDDLSYVEKREKLNTCFDIDDIDDIEHLTIDPALNEARTGYIITDHYLLHRKKLSCTH